MSRSLLHAFLLFLALVGTARAQGWQVALKRGPEGKPAMGIQVELDERSARSGFDGTARFPVVDSPPQSLIIRDLDHHFVEHAVTAEEQEARRIELELVPIARTEVTVSTGIEGLERPVAGATVSLTRRGADYLALVVEAATGWDGRYVVHEVPAGTYEWTCEAPGCIARAGVLEVGAEPLELTIDLLAALEECRVRGTVRDVRGEAIPGALVVVELASGADELARTTSRAGGSFELTAPLLGSRPRGAEGAAAIEATRGPAVVTVAADGFTTGCFPVELGAGGALLDARLWPRTESLAEAEPNDEPNTAPTVPPTATIALQLSGDEDVDCFRLPLATDGRLHVESDGIPVSLWLRLIDRSGAVIAEQGSHSRSDLRWSVDLRRGSVVLQVGRWGRAPATGLFSLRVAHHEHLDVRERNDEPATAALLDPGERCRGFLFPTGDADVWRLAVATPGTAQAILSPNGASTWMHAEDAGGQRIRESSAHAKSRNRLEFPLQRAGGHRLLMTHWGTPRAALDATTLTYDVVPGDGGEHGLRDNSPEHARPLEPDSIVAGTLNPIDDVDYRRIVLHTPGVLRVRTSALPISTWLRVRDASGKILAEGGAHSHRAPQLDVSIPRRGTYLVEVTPWGGNQWSPAPYLLKTAWYPDDPRDRIDNERLARATPISIATIVTGQIGKLGDTDCYRLHVPARAVLRTEHSHCSLSRWMRIHGPGAEILAEQGAHSNQASAFEAHVKTPGWQTITVEHWGDKSWSRDAYVVLQSLTLEDPFELGDDQRATPLRSGQSLRRSLLPADDVDRFVYFATAPGRQRVVVTGVDTSRWMVVFDASGEKVAEGGGHSGAGIGVEWEAPAPGRYVVQLGGWGGGRWSRQHYAIWAGPKDAAEPPRATLAIEQEPGSQRHVRFTIAAEGPSPITSYELDCDGDGQIDWRGDEPGVAEYVFSAPGWHTASLRVTDAEGRTGFDYARFNTREPRDDRGLQVAFATPAADATLEERFEVEVLAWSPDGTPVREVVLEGPGGVLGRWNEPPYETTLDPLRWAGRDVELRAIARGGGIEVSTTLPLRVSPFLALQPADDALLTSPEVVFAWEGRGGAAAEVVVEAQDGVEQRFAGGDGPRYRALASSLERDREYTWFVQSGDLQSARRSFRLVRGLEFSARRYEYAIERAYDQEGTLRVVNHGEQPARLILHAGSEQEDLLVGFVGEGSPDKVIELAPGETQEVLLGLAAQDANSERYSFPVTLEGTVGDEVHSDSALVDVAVRMPNVELETVLVEQDPETLVCQVEVRNRGDALTDLAVRVEPAGQIWMTPAIDHATLGRGASKSFRVAPVLSEDFQGLEAVVTVKAVHKTFELPISFQLPEGARVYLATVDVTSNSEADSWYCTNRPRVDTAITVGPGAGMRGTWPGWVFGGGLGRDPFRVPLSQWNTQEGLAAMHERLTNWIKRRILNPKHQNVAQALLDSHLHQVDGTWVGDPEAALRALCELLRQSNFSELTSHERWLAETRRGGISLMIDQTIGDALSPLNDLASSSSSGWTSYLGTLFPSGQAAEIAASWRNLMTAASQLDSADKVKTLGELATRQNKVNSAIERLTGMIKAATDAPNVTSEAARSDLVRRMLEAKAGLQLRARNLDQATRTLNGHVDKIKQHMGQTKWFKKWGNRITGISFLVGWASRYEKHSRREGMSEATAVTLSLVEAGTYTGITTVPIVAVADLAITGIGTGAGWLGAEINGTNAGDINLPNLLDAGMDHIAYGVTSAISEDQQAAAPVSMQRLREIIDRLDERLDDPHLLDEHRRVLEQLRDRSAQMLLAKENDP